MSPNLKTALLGYLYSGISVAAALWTSGQHDWKVLLQAALAGMLGPLAQALNPKDAALGIKPKKK